MQSSMLYRSVMLLLCISCVSMTMISSMRVDRSSSSPWSSSLEMVESLDETMFEQADDASLIELSKLPCPTSALAKIHVCKVLIRTLRQEGKIVAKVGKGFEICQIARLAQEDPNTCGSVHDHIAEVGQRWDLNKHYRDVNDAQSFCIQVLADPVNSIALLSPRTERACTGKATAQDAKFAAEPNAPKGYTGNILEDPFNTDIYYINGCRCTCNKVKAPLQECCDCKNKCRAPKKLIKGVCRLPDCPTGQVRVKGKCTTVCTPPRVKVHGKCVIKCPPKHKIVGDNCVPIVKECKAPKQIIDGVCKIPGVKCELPKKWINGECKVPVTCVPPKKLVNGACQEESIVKCEAPKKLVNGVCILEPVIVKCEPPKKLIGGECKLEPIPDCKAPGPYSFPYTQYGVKSSAVHVVVDIKLQRIRLYQNGKAFKEYITSTSETGMGSARGSLRTPIGQFRISEKYGANAPIGADFVALKRNGKFSKESDKAALQTRVIAIEGLDAGNKNTRERLVFIHGTNKVNELGKPASQGCFRLSNTDMIDFFNHVHASTRMFVVPECAWNDQVVPQTGGLVIPKPIIKPVIPPVIVKECKAPQTLVNGVCVDPKPKKCKAPQTLVNGVCVDPKPVDPVKPIVKPVIPPVIVKECKAPRTLVNGVCVDPKPVVKECKAPQTLVNGVCTDPKKPDVPVVVPPVVPDPVIDPNCRGPQCPCPPNQIRVALKCTNICLGPGCKKCRKGEVDVKGKCIRPHSGTKWRCRGPHCGGCADGYYRSDGHCESNVGYPTKLK